MLWQLNRWCSSRAWVGAWPPFPRRRYYFTRHAEARYGKLKARSCYRSGQGHKLRFKIKMYLLKWKSQVILLTIDDLYSRAIKAYLNNNFHFPYNKKFLEEKFNLTAEFCADIESHTNETIYTEVEKEVLIRYLFQDLPMLWRWWTSTMPSLLLTTSSRSCCRSTSGAGVTSLAASPSSPSSCSGSWWLCSELCWAESSWRRWASGRGWGWWRPSTALREACPPLSSSPTALQRITPLPGQVIFRLWELTGVMSLTWLTRDVQGQVLEAGSAGLHVGHLLLHRHAHRGRALQLRRLHPRVQHWPGWVLALVDAS